MIGYIDVGGGMRGIYGAGVADRCLDDADQFDCLIGVSAGAANILSFLAKQRGRNYTFFHEYSFRKRYMSIGNFIRHRGFFDLDYVFDELSGSKGEYPLDVATAKEYKVVVNIVTADAVTGKPHYFTLNDIEQDQYEVVKATCALPLFCRIAKVYGRQYFDGGVADPVPIDRAFELGCDKVVLVLTKPRDVRRDSVRDDRTAKFIRRKYPEAARALHNRAVTYNNTVDRAIELEKEGKILILAPDDTCGVDTLKRTKERLKELYDKGYADAAAIRKFMQS